jgi:hypothetical protein
VALESLREQFKSKVTRLPVLDAAGVAKYIVHQSTVFKFLAEKARHGASATDLGSLTLDQFIADPEMRSWVTALAYVPVDGSLADAKGAMERVAGCQDVIVTEGGRSDQALVGWLTNVDIGRRAEA